MADAVLGQQANINLGGYIPAPARQPKLWQQVLAQFIGNVATQAGGAALERMTAPDLSRVNTETGAVAPTKGGFSLHRDPNAQEIAALRGSQQGQQRTNLEGKQVDAGIRQGDARLENENKRLNLEAMTVGSNVAESGEKIKLAQAQHQLAREQFAQAKTEADRNYWLQQMRLYEDVLSSSFDQKYKGANLRLQGTKLNDEMSKTPAEIDELRARAEYERGLGRTGQSGKLTPEQMRAQIKAMFQN